MQAITRRDFLNGCVLSLTVDVSAYAYIDGAVDAADRAVNEQLG